MNKALLPLAALSLLLTPAASAQTEPAGAPSPGEIAALAAPEEWVSIAPADLLVMTLAPAEDGAATGSEPRQVIIQLMPPPFSQGWVANIRTLAREHWYDGTSINRVQDNYVVQWGDPDGEDAAKAKPLPGGLNVMDEGDYVDQLSAVAALMNPCGDRQGVRSTWLCDSYSRGANFEAGWPTGTDGARQWPVHCYGMVGVGRGLSPDTGSGAELYTVIGHAPRHLDRNIALVGRVVEGIEHLSSLPRGKGDLGFYEDPARRVPIRSIRLASELPPAEQPHFVYLDTEGATFARYAEARANRRDPFFIQPAGGADICNIPVPVRRATDR